MTYMKRLLWGSPLILVGVLLTAGPGVAERSHNRVLSKPPYKASARALALHRTLTIADLHADTLLWNRDLLDQSTSGHVHAVGVVGADAVALGSDFDGAVTAPFEVTGLPLLTDALLSAGLGEEEVAKIMGGNAVRVLRQALPRE